MTPFDYIFRIINRLGQYPPLHLRRHVGHLGAGFNGPGYEFVSYLRLLTDLKTGHSLWDLGCGCGMLELALEDMGWTGSLVGTDIHKPSIEWATRHIGVRIPDHKFIHSDIYNAAYWRNGRMNAQTWLEAFPERDFDVVIAKSFFTHVLPEELNLYLKSIADRMKVGGKALLTFFILTEEQKRLAKEGKNHFSFHPYAEDGCCAVRRPSAPTAAVAYEQQYLMTCFRDAGFKTDHCRLWYGAWTGRNDVLSFQDIILATKQA